MKTNSPLEKSHVLAAILVCCLTIVFTPLSCYADVIPLTGLQDGQTLWLVNRNAPIDKNYYASDLRSVQGSPYLLRERAATAYESMYAAMQAAAVGKVYLRSTYRSYDTQSYLFHSRTSQRQKSGMTYQKAYAATARFTAIPGTSEHQTGLAADMTCGGALSSSFGNTPQGKWMASNSWKYGFILRYSGAKETYTMIGDEPWHFRYVGMPHSQIIYENGWSYEEYIYHLKTTGKFQLQHDSTHLFEVYYFPSQAGIPAQIPDSSIQAASASVYYSSDNAGGCIITIYGMDANQTAPEATITGY